MRQPGQTGQSFLVICDRGRSSRRPSRSARGGEDGEQGIALAVTLFALVVIGGLVASAMLLGLQELRLGRNATKRERAIAAAESGTALAIAAWRPSIYNRLPAGSTAGFSGTLGGRAGWYRGTVRRLSDLLFLVQSEGFSADSQARQQLGHLVRLRPPEFDPAAALTTLGATLLGGAASIHGAEAPPPGWPCHLPRPEQPGLRIRNADDLSVSQCRHTCVVGDPPILPDPRVGDSNLDLPFLGSRADAVLGSGTWTIRPAVSNGECRTSDPLNWGDPDDPAGPCRQYFPLIHADGDITLHGVRGQGVLVVDGDLVVRGGFRFYGLVVVRGTFSTAGTGGRFTGAVIAAAADLTHPTALDGSTVAFSSCALYNALTGSAHPRPLAERGWISLPQMP